MPPKVDPNSEFDLYLRVRGGVNLPAQSIAPKVGPYGLPPKMVSDKILEATKAQGYTGIRVSIKLHSKQRQPTIFVLPTASSFIMKALNEGPRNVPKGQQLVHSGTLPFDQVLAVAKQLRFKSYAVTFAGTVCEILGTCQSIGCKIKYAGADQAPHAIIDMIKDGSLEIEDFECKPEERVF